MKFVRIDGVVFLALMLCFASQVQEARAAQTFVNCTPTEVAAFGGGLSRVHVQCMSAINGVVFFAVPSGDADLANKVLSLGATAVVFDRDLNILFDPDDNSGPEFGCGIDNCRPILGIRLLR